MIGIVGSVKKAGSAAENVYTIIGERQLCCRSAMALEPLELVEIGDFEKAGILGRRELEYDP